MCNELPPKVNRALSDVRKMEAEKTDRDIVMQFCSHLSVSAPRGHAVLTCAGNFLLLKAGFDSGWIT